MSKNDKKYEGDGSAWDDTKRRSEPRRRQRRKSRRGNRRELREIRYDYNLDRETA